MGKIKSAITVSLVEEARGGPFVFWDGLQDAFEQAAKLGFDAIEIFAADSQAVDPQQLHSWIAEYGLPVAAVGTGAGMVKHGLSLTDVDPHQRASAIEFVRRMIDFGGQFKAPAIIGSMQGRWGGEVSLELALDWLGEALDDLGNYAQQYAVPLLYEPLNRYETNLIKTIEAGVSYLQTLETTNVRLLADLFHMNIEEASLTDALRTGAGWIGHVHFVDSNRQAAGLGHLDFEPIANALRDTDYSGYLSAEAFPIPDSEMAAHQTIDTFRRYFG